MLVGLNNASISRNNYARQQSFGAELVVSGGREVHPDSLGFKWCEDEHVRPLPISDDIVDDRVKEVQRIFAENTKDIPGFLKISVENDKKRNNMYVRLRYGHDDYRDDVILDRANYDSRLGIRKWENRDSYRRGSAESYSKMFESALGTFVLREKEAKEVTEKQREINSQIASVKVQKKEAIKAVEAFDAQLESLKNDRINVAKTAYENVNAEKPFPFKTLSDEGIFAYDRSNVSDSGKPTFLWKNKGSVRANI